MLLIDFVTDGQTDADCVTLSSCRMSLLMSFHVGVAPSAVRKWKDLLTGVRDEGVENIFSHPEGRHTDLKVLKLLSVAGLSLLDVATDILFAIRKGFKNTLNYSPFIPLLYYKLTLYIFLNCVF